MCSAGKVTGVTRIPADGSLHHSLQVPAAVNITVSTKMFISGGLRYTSHAGANISAFEWQSRNAPRTNFSTS